jgi:hypothetical protein
MKTYADGCARLPELQATGQATPMDASDFPGRTTRRTTIETENALT